MKRLLSIFALCLLSAAALMAQQTYSLTVRSIPQGIGKPQIGYTPANGGWTYTTANPAQIYPGRAEAALTDIYTGWRIKEWRVTEGTATLPSDFQDNYIYFTMPASDVTVTAILEYDPSNPANPMPNGWYPDEGKLVVDYLDGSSFLSCVRQLIPDQADYSLVRTIFVGGTPSSFGMSYVGKNRFENLRRLDLSRLNERFLKSLSSECRNQPWEELMLPVGVQGIGTKAFEGTFLRELTVYALTPPKLTMQDTYNDQGEFIGQQQISFPSSRDMTVYVPEESLPLYQAADGWKEFNLQPIVEDAANLTVSVNAAGGDLSPYYGMTLEIVNVKNLNTRSMIIGNRKDYTFSTLPKHTSYDVRLLSRTGSIVAQAANVRLDEEDVSVALSNLRRPCSLQIALTAGNTTVSPDQYDCLWLDTEGRILSRGPQINAILEDEAVQARITLTDRTLKANYRERDTISISRPGDYAQGYTHSLRIIPTHQLTASVRRADGQFIGRQTVQLTINHAATGQFVRQLSFNTLTADGSLSSGPMEPLPEGIYDVTARVEDSRLSAVTQRLTLTADQTLTFLLTEANGSTVSLKWTHWGVADEGADANTASSRERVATEAAITLRDVTNGRSLKDFAFGANNTLRLQELLEPGTEVDLTIGNENNPQFAPVTQRSVADADGNLSFDVTTRDYGTLNVSFTETECSRVSIRLYNSSGQLVNAVNAITTSEVFKLLKDDEYTVLLMEGGTMADAMNTLTNVEQFMTRGTDYVSQQVQVSGGQTTVALFTNVPALSSAVHLYTDDSFTRVTPKKPQITAGLYQTFTTQVVFRPEYQGHVSQLKVVINLPDDDKMSFVEGSVIFDNSSTAYEIKDSQLTIPIIEKRLMRFCMIPLETGQKSLSAKITFLLDGIPCEQPLSSSSFTVSGAEIFCKTVTNSEEVLVRGTALPSVPVTLFLNNEVAGTVNSNSQGEWQMNVVLPNAYNGSENSIYAQYNNADGLAIKTETKVVKVDRYGIRPLTVRMSHFNAWKHAQQTVVFDLESNTCTPSSYPFYHEAEFTFDITLSSNDTTNIDRVMLYVYMTGGQRRILFPQFNPQTGTWVATDIFSSNGLPNQVRVYVEEHAPKVVGDQMLHDAIHFCDDLKAEVEGEDPELAAVTQQALNSEPGSAEEEEAMRQLMIFAGVNPDTSMNVEPLPDTPEATAQWEGEMDAALAACEAADAGFDALAAEEYFTFDIKPMNEMGQLLGGYHFSKLSSSARQYYVARARGENPAPLPAAGPNEHEYVLDLESGEHVYYRLHDEGYVIVVPTEDLQITCNYAELEPDVASTMRNLRQQIASAEALARQAPFRSSEPGFVSSMQPILNQMSTLINAISTALGQLESLVQQHVETGVKAIEENVESIHKSTMEAWDKFHAGSPKMKASKLHSMKIRGAKGAEQLERLRLGKVKLENLGKLWQKIGIASNLLSILSIIDDYNALISTYETLQSLYYSVPNPCPKNQGKADNIRNSIDNWGKTRLVQKGASLVANASSFATGLVSLVSLIASGGTSALASGFGAGVSLAISLGNSIGNLVSDHYWEKWTEDWRKQINELECDSVKCPSRKPIRFDNDNEDLALGQGAGSAGGAGGTGITGCGNDECQKATPKSEDEGGCPGPPPPPPPGGTPIIDPSGYVYEAVGSNRVPQALATVYYRELYEDMYGDPHERTVLWDAEKYEQVNPMLTDENGEYGWDVPTGLWQVRVVKDGYLTTESEWLPVPPPQLDVNLAMVQPTPPVVERVVATEQGVQLRFDKFMKPQMLNADNIFLTRSGQKLEGTISLMDAEVTPDSARTYVRTVRFVPQQPLKLGEKVRLTVRAGVESYADVGMLQDFTQEFDVEQRVNEIVADSAVGILYGEEYTLAVRALPAALAKGKTVKAVSLDPTIAEVKTESVVLDQDGSGSLTLSGKGYGTTAVRLTLAGDEEVQTLTVVGVKDANSMQTRKPTSSRISGTEVTYGSSIRLSCETPGAVIYYTLDGSCPCDNPNRLRYDGPIICVSDMTLKAVAIAPGYAESSVATFVYRVKPDPQSVSAVETERFSSPVYTLQGVRMPSGQRLHQGIYVVQGRKVVVR